MTSLECVQRGDHPHPSHLESHDSRRRPGDIYEKLSAPTKASSPVFNRFWKIAQDGDFGYSGATGE